MSVASWRCCCIRTTITAIAALANATASITTKVITLRTRSDTVRPISTADRDIDFTILSPTTTGWVQAGAIVLGHVGGVIAAHDRALELYGRANAALRSQYALLGVMLAYTAAGLYLLVGS